MLRRCVAASHLSTAPALYGACRQVTSKGQFNPIHDFSVGFGKYSSSGANLHGSAAAPPSGPLTYAKNEEEFEKLITNPGPLRIGYSPDYLQWLYLAYQNKAAYELEQQQKQKGNPQTSSSGGNDRDDDAEAVDEELGRFLRPPTSLRRRGGEAKRAAAQQRISELVRRQGFYDLLERQPQFPFIDLTNATRFHYVALFKHLVLDYYANSYFSMTSAAGGADGDGEFSFAQELWDKALMYRAVLSERRGAYPSKSFQAALDAVKDVNLAPSEPVAASNTVAAAASTNVLLPLADRCPSQDSYIYMLYLVKKYLIQNAVEAHIVLKAHRQPNAADLLFSVPPPKSDGEVLAALAKDAAAVATTAGDTEAGETTAAATAAMDAVKRVVARKPGRYPPIEALWRCEENLPLLKVLVFGELNLFVSENPFAKFPNALPFLTRPYASSPTAIEAASAGAGSGDASSSGRRGPSGNRQSRQSDALSLAMLISERRGTLLAPIPRNVANVLDSRGADIRRQQQRFHREDILAFSKVLQQHAPSGSSSSSAGSGAGAAAAGSGKSSSSSTGTGSGTSGATDDNMDALFYGAYADFNYYNPRTTRAERRDYLSRQTIAALADARAAADGIYRRDGVEEAYMNQQFGRLIEDVNVLPANVPTVPRYAAMIRGDPHVSYLLHARSGEARASVTELERHVAQLARAMYATALSFHEQATRRVNQQKVNVAASLLDTFVERELTRVRLSLAPTSTSNAAAAASDEMHALTSDALRLLTSLGTYKRFEGRPVDEFGNFTDARMDDYRRWMAAP